MGKLSKAKVLLHSIALLSVMFLGDFVASLPFDILFRFISLPFDWMYGALRIISCIGITFLLFRQYTKRILHCDMKFFRCDIPKIHFLDVILAFILPAMVIVSYISFGTVYVNPNMTKGTIFSIILLALFRALKAGILEELLFRGFILKLIEIKWNRNAAIIAPSLIFSLAHIPSMQSFGFIDLFLLICSGTLVGIMFSLATYRNNSIWGSVLIHIMWNFAIISNVIHFGREINNKTIFSIVFSTEHSLFTGGSFGIESSIIAIVAYLIITLIILLYMKHRKQRIEHNTKPSTSVDYYQN
jgi:uncharacterized protein